MDLFPYAARLHRDLHATAEAGGQESLAVAERLTAALDSSIRVVLLDALVEAAAQITGELAPGSVEVRLRGREVDFAVSPPGDFALAGPASGVTMPGDATPQDDSGDAGTARLSLRLPERLKTRVEAAADAAGLSVNAWLVRSIGAFVESEPHPPTAPPAPPAPRTTGQRHTGWVR